MEKKRFMKFIKGCQIIKIVKKGNNPRITMKCPKRVINKIKSAQELIQES